jgi:hypothetical protein
MIPDPDDPAAEAIGQAVEALATAQGTAPSERSSRAAFLAQAARYVAAAQAAVDKAPDPAPNPPREPPSVTLARLQGQITYMHHGSAGPTRPLWAAVQTLAGVVESILRRLPPEP